MHLTYLVTLFRRCPSPASATACRSRPICCLARRPVINARHQRLTRHATTRWEWERFFDSGGAKIFIIYRVLLAADGVYCRRAGCSARIRSSYSGGVCIIQRRIFAFKSSQITNDIRWGHAAVGTAGLFRALAEAGRARGDLLRTETMRSTPRGPSTALYCDDRPVPLTLVVARLQTAGRYKSALSTAALIQSINGLFRLAIVRASDTITL